MNFYDGLERYGNAPAFIGEDKIITYSELAETADKIAAGIPERSLAFVVCTNNAAAAAGYLGMLRKRAVPIMINSKLDSSLYESLNSTYKPQYIWAPRGFKEGCDIMSCDNYVLTETGEAAPEMNGELALLLTTSGSTGSRKLVRQTYGNINGNADSIAEYLNIIPEDKAITTLPLNYTYGLSILHSHLAAGAGIVFTERTFLEKPFWSLLKKTEATNFGGVPYSYEILDRLNFINMELPSLRYITEAGGKLSAELQYKFAEGMRKAGKALIVMYGATEATARMSYVPSFNAVEKAGSIGIAIPGGRFELIDDNGDEITETDKTGELVYYGDNVTWGYAESREDLKLGDERHGRLETGDMAKVDEDGYYYIVGRKKRFLKLFGNRVNLMEIEALLEKKGYSCACVGEDDHMRIYTTSDDTDFIARYISEVTNLNKAAITAIHIGKIPRNDSGKVLYSELK